MSAYDSLTDDQQRRYAKLLKGYEKINPFDQKMAYKMLEVGLDLNTYHSLIESFLVNVHNPINETIPVTPVMDIEFRAALKTIYKQHEYF